MGQFEFYEIVRVRVTPETIGKGVAGLDGAILGKSAEDGGPVAAYAVWLYERERVRMFAPDELEPTGRHDRLETFYDGTSITVSPRGELLAWNEPPDQGHCDE